MVKTGDEKLCCCFVSFSQLWLTFDLFRQITLEILTLHNSGKIKFAIPFPYAPEMCMRRLVDRRGVGPDLHIISESLAT